MAGAGIRDMVELAVREVYSAITEPPRSTTVRAASVEPAGSE